MTTPHRITLDGVDAGMELDELVFGPISRERIKAYADASGDDNPIHQDEEYAKASGAPTVFAMGMLPAGYLAHAVSDWFGGPQHLRRYKVRFTTRVWPGDEIVSLSPGLIGAWRTCSSAPCTSRITSACSSGSMAAAR